MGWQTQPALGFGLVQLVCLAFGSGTSGTCKWKTCNGEKIQYSVSETPGNWTSAKVSCELAGGHLATPQTPAQDTCIKSLGQSADEGLWIGLHSKKAWDAPFRYVNNDEKLNISGFTNWTTNELDLNKRCVAAGTKDRMTGWHIERCSNNVTYYVCESRGESKSGMWTNCPGQNVQYKLLTKEHGTFWGQSKSLCSSRNSTLATPRNRKQNDCVLQLAQGKLRWIGIARYNTPKYIDNSEEVGHFSNWTSTQPNSPDQLCTVLWTDRNGVIGWADDDCVEGNYTPLCQKRKSSGGWWHCQGNDLNEFSFSFSASNWSLSRKLCSGASTHLATPRNAKNNECILFERSDSKKRSSKTYWIGIAKLSNFQFVTDENDIREYVGWTDGQPKGSLEERCAAMLNKTGLKGWSVKQCSEAKMYICQRELHVNEWMQGSHKCSPYEHGGQCHNTDGSYLCSCRQNFTGNGFNCAAICQLSNFSNGQFKYDLPPTDPDGAFVNFSCNGSNGYVLEGEQRVICLNNGNWNGPTPTCDLVYCTDPPRTIKHGKNTSLANKITFRFGHVWHHQCKDGYEYSLQGQDQVTCTLNRNWSDVNGQCIRIDNSSSSNNTTIVVTAVPLAFVITSIILAVIAIRRNKKDSTGKKDLQLGRSKLATDPVYESVGPLQPAASNKDTNHELAGPVTAALPGGNNEQYDFAQHFQQSTKQGGDADI